MEDDFSIDWDFAILHWRRVLVGLFAGLAIAGLAFALVSPRWEASALIQVGQIGNSASSGVTAQIESIDAVVARMARPLFIQTALQRASHPEELRSLLPSAYDGDGHLIVRRMGTDIVVVTVQAPTKSLAKQLMEGVVGELVEEHNQIADARLSYDRRVLATLQHELEQNGRRAETGEQELFRDRLTSSDRQLALLITDELSEPNTRPTRAVGQIEVADRPVFPRPVNFLLLGALLGLGLASGLLWHAKANAH